MPFIHIEIGDDYLIRRRLRPGVLRDRRTAGLHPVMLETARPAVWIALCARSSARWSMLASNS